MSKVEGLVASMNKAAAKAEKVRGTIDRHFKALAKKAANLEALGYNMDYSHVNFESLYGPFQKDLQFIDDQKYNANGTSVNEYWELCEIANKLEDIRSAKRKLAEAEQVLSNWEKKVLTAQTKEDFINTQVPQVIIEFVDAWKQIAYEWHMKNDKNPNPESLEIHLENEKNIKILDLTSRVNEVVGKITDANYLDVSNSGNLNGFIIGEKGSARVETITAGGYNIQRFHYRTIVNKI